MDKKTKVILASWVAIVIVTIAAVLYFAQPMSEVKQIWTPKDYKYLNKVGSGAEFKVTSINFNARSVNVPFDSKYKQAFSQNEKSMIVLAQTGSHLNNLEVRYFAEENDVLYIASSSHNWIYFHELSQASLAGDQLQLSYSTCWLTVIISIIVLAIAELVIIDYADYKIFRMWVFLFEIPRQKVSPT